MQAKRPQFGILAQFLLSYCIVGILAAFVSFLLLTQHTQLSISILVSTLVSGCIGLLLTWNIQRGLARLEDILVHLAQNEPLENYTYRISWPLDSFFMQALRLNQHMMMQIQREKSMMEQREQLLQTVSAAAAQEERNRLARELHDSIKQQIFGIDMSAAAIAARLESGSGTLRTPLKDIRHSVQEAQVEMDALLQQLRPAPLTLAGLVESIRTQFEILSYRTNAQVAIEVHTLPTDERLTRGTTDALFRIVQETLANIARHAHAHSVMFHMYGKDNVLHIEIRDDGQGFDVNALSPGMGLANIKERTQALGGSIQMQSRPGETTIALSIPLLEQFEPGTMTNKEFDSYLAKAHTSQTVVNVALQASGICILVTTPFIVVVLGLLITLNWLRIAYREREHATQIAGKLQTRVLELQSKERELIAGVFILLGLSFWYLPVLTPHQPALLTTGVALILSLPCAVFALVFFTRYHHITTLYYHHLSLPERREQVQQKQHTSLGSLGVWLFVLILALFIGQFDLTLFPHTLNAWSSDATLALLILWPCIDIVDYLWHRRMSGSEQHTM